MNRFPNLVSAARSLRASEADVETKNRKDSLVIYVEHAIRLHVFANQIAERARAGSPGYVALMGTDVRVERDGAPLREEEYLDLGTLPKLPIIRFMLRGNRVFYLELHVDWNPYFSVHANVLVPDTAFGQTFRSMGQATIAAMFIHTAIEVLDAILVETGTDPLADVPAGADDITDAWIAHVASNAGRVRINPQADRAKQQAALMMSDVEPVIRRVMDMAREDPGFMAAFGREDRIHIDDNGMLVTTGRAKFQVTLKASYGTDVLVHAQVISLDPPLVMNPTHGVRLADTATLEMCLLNMLALMLAAYENPIRAILFPGRPRQHPANPIITAETAS